MDYEELENNIRIYNDDSLYDSIGGNRSIDDDDQSLLFDDSFDSSVNDIDFSQLSGSDFKTRFRSMNASMSTAPRTKQSPSPSKKKLVKGHGITKGKYAIDASKQKKIGRVLVPREREVIVEGVSKFILSEGKAQASIKNVGYYKGKKLKALVLTFNNNSALDFELELFNTSMPLDYLYSTSLNLNDKIQVAGDNVSYSDVLFNLLANPALIPNCKFVFSGPSVLQQKVQPLIVKNKAIRGDEKIHPINLDLQIDTMQVSSDIIFFDIMDILDRPYIPDGMDVLKYKVLAGNTVTMAFFYKQVSLKKVFYKEARTSKKLL